MLTISSTKGNIFSPTEILKNTCLLDYLSNTCGININKPDISRTLETYKLVYKNKLSDLYGNIWGGISEDITNFERKIWEKFKQ